MSVDHPSPVADRLLAMHREGKTLDEFIREHDRALEQVAVLKAMLRKYATQRPRPGA